MEPFNRILHKYPTMMPCSDLMPPRWEIGGAWYCVDPQPLWYHPPHQLNTTDGPQGAGPETRPHGAGGPCLGHDVRQTSTT